MRLLQRFWRPATRDRRDGDKLEELVAVNREIRDTLVGGEAKADLRHHQSEEKTELRHKEGEEQAERRHRKSQWVAWATFVATIVTIVVGFVGVRVSLQTRDAVRDIEEMTPQEVVEELRAGMPASELRQLMDVPPVADAIAEANVPLGGGETVRRILYHLDDKQLAIVAYTDPFNNVRVFSVTTLDPSLHLRFPAADSGTYAQDFVSGETTLGSLVGRCMDGVFDDGVGASWGYFAIGCRAIGANNDDGNIVAVNFFGPAPTQPGLLNPDLGDQMRGGDATAPDVAAITFNTFAWGDFDFLVGGANDYEAFAAFVANVQLGPARGEPVPTTEI